VLFEGSQLQITVTKVTEVESGLNMIIIKFKQKLSINDICVCR